MSADDHRRREREQRDLEKLRQHDRKASQRGRDSNDKGRRFHRGMAEILGESHWAREHPEKVGAKTRILDQARIVDPRNREFTEFKSGRVDKHHAMDQLRMDRRLLESGRYVSGKWVTVAKDGNLPKEIRQELEQLAREFPGRFQHLEISQAMALEAIERGKHLELARQQRQERTQGQQLELPGLSPQQLTAAEKARVQEAAARAIAGRVAEEAQRDLQQEIAAREAAERQRQQAEQARAAEQARQQAIQARESQLRELLPPEVARIVALGTPLPGEQRIPPVIAVDEHGHPRVSPELEKDERGRPRERD